MAGINVSWTGWNSLGATWGYSTWSGNGAGAGVEGVSAFGTVTVQANASVVPVSIVGTAALGTAITNVEAVFATGIEGTAGYGTATVYLQQRIVPVGLEAVGTFGVPLVWSRVNDAQTPNWIQVVDTQVPVWTAVGKVQTPGWAPVVH